MADKKKILITGAVGTQLINKMKERYHLCGLDRELVEGIKDTMQGDVANFDTLLEATLGMDAAIHLTGTDGEWEGVPHSNLIGTYNMLETARVNGVKRDRLRQPYRGARDAIRRGHAQSEYNAPASWLLHCQQGLR